MRHLNACIAESAQAHSPAMREVVLDTETTGLDPTDGHRIVEIACIELFNHLPTGLGRAVTYRALRRIVRSLRYRSRVRPSTSSG